MRARGDGRSAAYRSARSAISVVTPLQLTSGSGPSSAKAAHGWSNLDSCRTSRRLLTGEEGHVWDIPAYDSEYAKRHLFRSLGPRHGRCASRKIAVWIIGSGVCDKLSDKMVCIGSQKPLRIPGNRMPPADRRPTVDEGDGMNPCVGNQYALRHHRNAVARCCQRNERLRSGTFEDKVRSDTRRLAGRVEPFPRGKGSSK
jgi:hypothetical protein